MDGTQSFSKTPVRSGGLIAPRLLWLVTVVVVGVGCTVGDAEDSASTTQPALTTTDSFVDLTSSTVAQSDPDVACVPGMARAGIDLRFDDILAFYNQGNVAAMTALIGEGPVVDPSLEPGGPDRYPSVAAWLEAAEAKDDLLAGEGYGFYEPFKLFVARSNTSLQEVGIERVFLTLRFWVNQNCELRVDAGGDLVSAPDPCLYVTLYRPEQTGVACDAPFEPRAGHVAVWTGEEVLIYGGVVGSVSSPPLTTGLGFDPDTGSWRALKPSPEHVGFWPTGRAVWTGTEMVVAGRTPFDDDEEPVLMRYSPSADDWRVTTFPEGRRAVGGMVWTGEEVIVAGGDLHYPARQAWAYNPATETWRELPDPGIPEVEGIEGVWTGSEAIFLGGYVHPGMTTAAAYSPASDSWRMVTEPPEWIDHHDMVWTGQQVIIYSGNTGPGHRDRLLIYDPPTDQWSESSPMPIEPSQRLAGVWTGDQLMIWGGYATYGTGGPNNEGAVYDPETDTWTVLPPSPLDPRCDHSGTWTGEEFVVFGGMLTCGDPMILADGNAASYDPDTGRWKLLEVTTSAEANSTTLEGRLPDGTSYQVEFDPPLTTVEPEGVIAAIVLDLADEPETRQQLGCVHQCRAVAIGITTFSRTQAPTAFGNGTFRMTSGDWTMSINLYKHILDLWGDQAEQILIESVTPIDVHEGLPAFAIEPPLRWGTDTELPLQMEVIYESFVVRRGCGEMSVGCSPTGNVQLIPAEEVVAPAPEWDHGRTVTVADPPP